MVVMKFCPTCGMLLQYELPHMDSLARFSCPTCRYVCPIAPKIKIKRKQPLVKKEIDYIITKDDQNDTPKTEGICKFTFDAGNDYKLEQMVNMLLSSFKDHHPRVKWAAINAIDQLFTNLGPNLQIQYHYTVLPVLASAKDDFQNP